MGYAISKYVGGSNGLCPDRMRLYHLYSNNAKKLNVYKNRENERYYAKEEGYRVIFTQNRILLILSVILQ
jgi:hypothetical protein